MSEDDYAAALARKLRLKPPQTALALTAPVEYVAALRGALGADAVHDKAVIGSGYDVVSLFARSQAAVQEVAPEAIAATRAGGSLWIMWPKKTSGVTTDLSRDTLWPLLGSLGWEPVASIAVDDTWSALRFRPEREIQHEPSA